MESYQKFALLYHDLMDETMYDRWLKWIKTEIPSNQSILELGCGTGTLANKLAAEYDVTGLDQSSDMLTIAKANQTNPYLLVEGDMTDLSGLPLFDHIIALNDTVCYLPDETAVLKLFKEVYDHLNPGGVFLFDVHSPRKMLDFQNFSYHSETDNGILLWDSYEGEHPHSIEHDLTILTPIKDQTYHRFDERHYERTYELEQYKQLLQAAGFSRLHITSDFKETFASDDERWMFKVVKQ